MVIWPWKHLALCKISKTRQTQVQMQMTKMKTLRKGKGLKGRTILIITRNFCACRLWHRCTWYTHVWVKFWRSMSRWSWWIAIRKCRRRSTRSSLITWYVSSMPSSGTDCRAALEDCRKMPRLTRMLQLHLVAWTRVAWRHRRRESRTAMPISSNCSRQSSPGSTWTFRSWPRSFICASWSRSWNSKIRQPGQTLD